MANKKCFQNLKGSRFYQYQGLTDYVSIYPPQYNGGVRGNYLGVLNFESEL